MPEKNRHITLKIILGYLLILVIAITAIVYIFTTIRSLAVTDEPENHSRLKVYLVTHTLSLIHESEAFGQLMQPDKSNHNKLLNSALSNMDSLRLLTADSVQLHKIDTINMLIERKRINTRNLLQAIKDANTDDLYSRNIQRIIAVHDTVEIEKQVEIQQDTIMLGTKKRNFFRRLGDVFSPRHADTTIIVGSSKGILSDTLSYDPTEAISSALRNIQDSVAYQRKSVNDLLASRISNLQYNNSVITARINQLLRDIEEEEMTASYADMERKQQILKDASRWLIVACIIAALVIALFLFLILKDISRSKYYRNQLEKSKQYTENLLHSREKLMLMISHDIRAPLSSIIGSLDLLKRNDTIDKRSQEYLNNMMTSSKHILSLVNNVLDGYRLEAGLMNAKMISFDPKSLINDIYAGFEPLAMAKGIDFRLQIEEPDAMLCEGDPILIRQVVENLLSNALKFTTKGSVELSASINIGNEQEKNGLLIISVLDTGPGMDEDEQQKIFRDFTRLPQSEQIEGVGLGLGIAQKIVHFLGGTMRLESRVGEGSRFEVSLPVSINENQYVDNNEANSSYSTIKSITKKNIHCLLIDDDPFQLNIIAEMLKQMHIRVTTCGDTKKMLELLHDTIIDLIITDIHMPGVDGKKIPEMVRNSGIPKTNKIPVVALTASVDITDEEYKSLGFNGYLSKPVIPEKLITLLNELLDVGITFVQSLNFSSLLEFAVDDKEASLSILKTFSKELINNAVLFANAYKSDDRNTVSELSHKMIPTLQMLKADDLVRLLRDTEKETIHFSEDEWHQTIKKILSRLEEVEKETADFITSFHRC